MAEGAASVPRPVAWPFPPAAAATSRRASSAAVLLAFLLIAFPLPSRAQGGGDDRIPTAPVIVDGEVLFRVRGVSAYPAEVRAETIADAIRAIAADRSIDPASLAADISGRTTTISIGGRKVMSVFDADAEVEDVDRDVLVGVIGRRVQQAIREYREDRSSRNLLTRTGFALGATVALGILLLGMGWFSRRAGMALKRRLQRRVESLEARSSRILQAEQVFTVLRGMLRVLHTLAVLVVVYAYLNSVLGLFPWTRAIASQLFEHVLEPLRVVGSGLIAYLPNLIFLVIFGFIVRGALRLLRMLFDALSRGRLHWPGFEPEWSTPTYRLVRLLVLAFSLVVAYPYIPGSESAAFKGMSIFLGVLVSLGSTSVVANIVAGQTLIYRRAFKVGDRIRVGAVLGDVSEIRALGTRIRTPKNEEVVVPNSTLLTGEIVNYSSLTRKQGLILHTSVGIGYEVPWRQVEAILLLAAQRTGGLKEDPAPFVLQTALGDFAVTYELNVYCDDASRMNLLYSELHRNILDAFNEHGVQIMTPAYESDPSEPKLVPPDRWHAPPAEPE